MKRYFCFFLAVLITAMSIIFYCPFNIYANDAFTISKNSTEKTGLSADEAQKAIDANADIKGKDGVTMLLYTPSDSYNYTLKSGAFVAHLSDSQAKAMLMSKKSFQQYVVLCSSLISNGTVFRGFLKTVGIATTGDSNALTNIVDKFTCNYNYLDSINYDEDTQTIVMSNDNSAVDKLREEIMKQYYSSIGCFYIKSSGKPFNAVNNLKNKYEYEDDLNSDLTASNNYDCAISFKQYSDFTINYFWDDSDFAYLFFDNCGNGTSYYPKVLAYSNDGLTKHNPCMSMKSFYGTYINKTDDSFRSNKYIGMYNGSNIVPLCNKDNIAETNFLASKFDCGGYFTSYTLIYYSKTGKPFTPFKSYSSYYNFINGDQNAYLSSTIEKTGEDITFSIKDMNVNLGNKLDTLIDSINSNKSNMSADELQNAIDKGLADLNKNTEDIKDNTEEMNNKLDSILEALNTQNETLLEILGVTKKISDTVDDIDDTANFNTVISLCGTVFLAIQSAILYGQNTLKDDNNNTASQSLASNNDDVILYASGGGTSLDYRGGIFGHFPFSVIYHLYDWLKVLQTQPKCPEFSYNYGYLIGKKDDENCVITFDLSQYEDWRKTISSFMKLSFTLAVAVGTYKKFKGGDVT